MQHFYYPNHGNIETPKLPKYLQFNLFLSAAVSLVLKYLLLPLAIATPYSSCVNFTMYCLCVLFLLSLFKLLAGMGQYQLDPAIATDKEDWSRYGKYRVRRNSWES